MLSCGECSVIAIRTTEAFSSFFSGQSTSLEGVANLAIMGDGRFFSTVDKPPKTFDIGIEDVVIRIIFEYAPGISFSSLNLPSDCRRLTNKDIRDIFKTDMKGDTEFLAQIATIKINFLDEEVYLRNHIFHYVRDVITASMDMETTYLFDILCGGCEDGRDLVLFNKSFMATGGDLWGMRLINELSQTKYNYDFWERTPDFCVECSPETLKKCIDSSLWHGRVVGELCNFISMLSLGSFTVIAREGAEFSLALSWYITAHGHLIESPDVRDRIEIILNNCSGDIKCKIKISYMYSDQSALLLEKLGPNPTQVASLIEFLKMRLKSDLPVGKKMKELLARHESATGIPYQ